MIKICGIKNVQQAKELAKLDIDFFGLIFAKSKREVSIENAKEIFKIFKSHGKKVVGVFTDENKIQEVLNDIKLDVLQLHNDFSFEFCKQMYNLEYEIWRVFRVNDKMPEFGEFEAILNKNIPNFYPMFDTLGKNLGGNNQSFNHKILNELSSDSFILAGGLNENNALIANSYKPYVLDFNSGVETNENKDISKIKNIIKILKEDK